MHLTTGLVPLLVGLFSAALSVVIVGGGVLLVQWALGNLPWPLSRREFVLQFYLASRYPLSVFAFIGGLVLGSMVIVAIFMPSGSWAKDPMSLWLGVAATVVAGLLLYYLRSRHPFLYGLGELGVALSAMMLAATDHSMLDPTKRTLTLATGLYVWVRGMDNIDRGLPRSLRSTWNIWFPKYADRQSPPRQSRLKWKRRSDPEKIHPALWVLGLAQPSPPALRHHLYRPLHPANLETPFVLKIVNRIVLSLRQREARRYLARRMVRTYGGVEASCRVRADLSFFPISRKARQRWALFLSLLTAE